MELVKKNIHFNRITKNARNQITLEEDVNIPDTKEDIESILFHNQRVTIEEVKVGDQKVHIRGRLSYAILYRSEESGRLCSMEGSIPIEEKLYMEGIENSDKVTVKACIEDFSAGIINSRKISLQSILDLKAYVQELYDEQITTAVEDEESEVLKKECEFTQLAVCKKDIFRFRENITIPNNMPNVEEVIWKNICVQEFECKTLDGQLSIQGKVLVFIIYEGERDSHHQTYQTTVPFNATLECSGSNMNMLSDISYDIVDSQVHLESDFDGEARSFGIEMVFELDINIYATEKVATLWDLYGIQKELTPTTENISYDVLSMNQNGNMKVADTVRIPGMEEGNCRILYGEGDSILEKYEVTEEGIMVHGMLQCQVLFEQGNEENEYNSGQSMIPFSQLIEFPKDTNTNWKDILNNLSCNIQLHCNLIQFAPAGEGEMEVRANVDYGLLMFEKKMGRNITGVDVKEMDMEKCNNLPSMAIYFAKPGDSLWEMGKKYCVPIRQIREMNHISSEDIKTGERVLIVRGAYS